MPRFARRATPIVLILPAVLSAQTRHRTEPARPVPVRWTLAPTGNQARFTVREQLAGAELSNDAVGTTQAVTGAIVLAPNGQPDSAQSRITIDLRTLTTDKPHRDSYIKSHTIVTDSFPDAVFVPTALTLSTNPALAAGPIAGTITGLMTVHGVTRSITWDVGGTAGNGEVSGKATTHIHFGEFNMTQPRVMIVMSVVDDLALEYDFHLVRGGTS